MNIKEILKKMRVGMEATSNIVVKTAIMISKISIKLFFLPFITFSKVVSFFKDVSRVLGESFVALFICCIGDLIAGVVLGRMTSRLEMLPGLLVLIPGAIGMRGNIFGALGSRLGSNLHIGTLSPELKKSSILNQNVESSIILTIIMSIFLAFMAKGFCILLNFESITVVEFTVISVLGGIFSGIVLLPATILISVKSYENGWDPDNVTTPLIATAGDFFTLPAIFLAIEILLWIRNGLLEIILFVFFILIAIAGFFKGLRGEIHLKKIIKQSTPTLFLCSILGTTAGVVLNSRLAMILGNPSILTLVPLFSGESGDLVSILAARLSSGLHSGYIEATLKPKGDALRNFGIIATLAIIIYPTIGLLAHFACIFLGIPSVGIQKMVLISFLAGILLTPFILIIAFYLSSISYKRGFDPDNIVIPLTTSLTDPVATTSLVIMVLLVLGFVRI